jgi:hypothetical protein
MSNRLPQTQVNAQKTAMQIEAECELGLASSLINRTYLNEIDQYPIIPLESFLANSQMEPVNGRSVRLIKITRIVHNTRENALDNLLNVFTALGSSHVVFLLLKSDGKATDFYLGLRSHGTDALGDSGKSC